MFQKNLLELIAFDDFFGKKLLPVISDYLWLEINITEDVTRIDSLLSLFCVANLQNSSQSERLYN